MESQDSRFALMARMLSDVAGVQSAYFAALRGLFQVIGRAPDASALVRQELERAYAEHQGQSTNPMFFEAFERAQAQILAALSPIADSADDSVPSAIDPPPR